VHCGQLFTRTREVSGLEDEIQSLLDEVIE
jgi:hypothetical protein